MDSSGCVDITTYPVFHLTPSEREEMEKTVGGVILDQFRKNMTPHLLRRTLYDGGFQKVDLSNIWRKFRPEVAQKKKVYI